MTIFRILEKPTPPEFSRFAVGSTTGTLYFMTSERQGLAIIGKGGVSPGDKYTLAKDELLPPGTKIEITV